MLAHTAVLALLTVATVAAPLSVSYDAVGVTGQLARRGSGLGSGLGQVLGGALLGGDKSTTGGAKMDTAATLSNTVEGLVAAVTQSKGGTALPIRDLSGSGSKSGSEQRPSLLRTRRRGVLPRGSVTDLTGGLTQTTDEVTGGALGVAQPGGAKKVGDVLNSMSTAIGDSTPAPAGSGGAKN